MALTIQKQPGTYVAARNHVAWLIDVDPNWKTYVDYYVEMTIEAERDYGTGVYFPLTKLREYPGDGNQVTFNIRDRIKAIVSHDIPVVDQVNVIKLQETVRRFKVTIIEWKQAVGAPAPSPYSPFIVQDPRYVYNAGFSEYVGQKMTDWVGDGKFLTNMPRSLAITDVQPWWLDFVAPADETYTAKVKIYYENGTDTVKSLSSIAADEGDVLRWPAGWKQAKMHIESQRVLKYEFYVEDSSSIVSERITFIDSCDGSALLRYYLFLNSLGGYDTLCTRGKLTSAEQVDSVSVRRQKGPFEAAEVAESFEVNSQHRETCEQYTGFLNRAQALWLRDMRRTEDAYRIGDRYPNWKGTGSLVPIRIERRSGPTHEDEALPEYTFTYEEAITHFGI